MIKRAEQIGITNTAHAHSEEYPFREVTTLGMMRGSLRGSNKRAERIQVATIHMKISVSLALLENQISVIKIRLES